MRNRKKIKASPPKPSALLFPGPRNTFTTDSSHQAVQGMARGQMEWGLHSVHPSPSQLLCPASLSPALGCSLLGTARSCGAPHGHSSFKKYPPSVPWALHRLQVGSAPGRFCGAAGDPCCKPGSPACAQRDPALGHRHCYTVLWKGLHLASSEITQICTR